MRQRADQWHLKNRAATSARPRGRPARVGKSESRRPRNTWPVDTSNFPSNWPAEELWRPAWKLPSSTSTPSRCVGRLKFDFHTGGASRRRTRTRSRGTYPATVKTMNAYENSYDLVYEDGDSESRVPARLIRPLATAAPRDLIPTPLTTTSQALETGGEL